MNKRQFFGGAGGRRGFGGGGFGASTFIALLDTPSSYTGQGGKVVIVKATENGLEFSTEAAIDRHDVKAASIDNDPQFLEDKLVSSEPIIHTTETGTGGASVLRSSIDQRFGGYRYFLPPVKDFFDPSSGLPGSPADGEIYIATADGYGWFKNNLYRYYDGSWQTGVTAVNGVLVYIIEKEKFYRYQGTSPLYGEWFYVSTVCPGKDFFADSLLSPNNANWAVNALATLAADSLNNSLSVRQFDDTTEEGTGFSLVIPPNASNIIISFISRAQTAPGAATTVLPRLYMREIIDNTTVGAWSAAFAMTALDIPTNTRFQYDTQIIPLSTLSLTAGRLVQFELTRNPADGLTGDWNLVEIKVDFV